MMAARNIHPLLAAVLAAFCFLMVSAPTTAGSMDELQKGWKDLKTSVQKAPEEMKADGEKIWKGAKGDAAEAAERSKKAIKDTPGDAKEGWEEVKDAVKSQ